MDDEEDVINYACELGEWTYLTVKKVYLYKLGFPRAPTFRAAVENWVEVWKATHPPYVGKGAPLQPPRPEGAMIHEERAKGTTWMKIAKMLNLSYIGTKMTYYLWLQKTRRSEPPIPQWWLRKYGRKQLMEGNDTREE